MTRSKQGQVLAIGSALSIGLGLVVSYLLGWIIGVAVASFTLGGTFLFVAFLFSSPR